MPRKAISKTFIRKKTIAAMKKLGVYKPEYDRVIDIYSELNEQYELLYKRFAESDYQYETNTGADGVKKDPLVSTLESLRKDILQYSDRLRLNPKANMEVGGKAKKQSALAKALSNIE